MSATSIPAPSALPRYLTINDVQAALQCSRQSVYNLVSRGTLPPILKLGASARFKESELLEALAKIEAARAQPLDAKSLNRRRKGSSSR